MKKKIYLQLDSIRPDPFSYKPYNPTLRAPDGGRIFVMVEIEEEGVFLVPQSAPSSLRQDDVIISAGALAELMGTVAQEMRARLQTD